MVTGLQCEYEQDQSACVDGRGIEIVGKREMNITCVGRDSQHECPNINGSCEIQDVLQHLQYNKTILGNETFALCLKASCRGPNELCCSVDNDNDFTNTNDSDQSNFSIDILRASAISDPTCSIVLTDPGERRPLSIDCSWPQEYFGVNATLQFSGMDSIYDHKCRNTQYNATTSLKISRISPRFLFETEVREHASCHIHLTKSKIQRSCEFNLYLDPHQRDVAFGRYAILTCPTKTKHLGWWEIANREIINLTSSENSVEFLKYYPDGEVGSNVYIFCGVEVEEKILVFGIGKLRIIDKPDEADWLEHFTGNLLQIPLIICILIAVAVALVMSFGSCIILATFWKGRRGEYKTLGHKSQHDQSAIELSLHDIAQSPLERDKPKGASFKIGETPTGSVRYARGNSGDVPKNTESELKEASLRRSGQLGGSGRPSESDLTKLEGTLKRYNAPMNLYIPPEQAKNTISRHDDCQPKTEDDFDNIYEEPFGTDSNYINTSFSERDENDHGDLYE